jgi:hypothetical protein
MDEKFDIWLDHGYDGWGLYFGLNIHQVEEITSNSEMNGQAYIVYKTKDRQIESS